MNTKIAIKPFLDIFTRSQVQSVLLAWLPIKLNPYLTGLIAVDMFITTVIASGTCTLAYLIYNLLIYLLTGNLKKEKSITIQIEYYSFGQYNERKKNIVYESISWLITQQSKKLQNGSFILKVIPNMNNKGNTKLISNILPEVDHEITIEYKGSKFNLKYKIPDNKNNNLNNINSDMVTMIVQEKPSIYLTTSDNTNVDDIYELLNDLTEFYLEFQK